MHTGRKAPPELSLIRMLIQLRPRQPPPRHIRHRQQLTRQQRPRQQQLRVFQLWIFICWSSDGGNCSRTFFEKKIFTLGTSVVFMEDRLLLQKTKFPSSLIVQSFHIFSTSFECSFTSSPPVSSVVLF